MDRDTDLSDLASPCSRDSDAAGLHAPISIKRNGGKEGSRHTAVPAIMDEQELRAHELELLERFSDAQRVRRCRAAPFPQWRCRHRQCPSCSAERAAYLFRRATTVLRAMRTRTMCLFTVCSVGSSDLHATIGVFRRALATVRRRRCLKAVKLAVACIEPKLSEDGRRWSVHAHLVVDVAENSLDVPALDRGWRALVRVSGRSGSFSLHPTRPAVADGEIFRVGRYITKARDVAPRPGTMALERLEVLRGQLRCVRLPIVWRPRKGRH